MKSSLMALPRLKTASKCMQRMDRARWSVGFVFCSHGLRIGVRATDADLLERMIPCLPPGWRPTSGEGVDHLYSLSAGVDGRRYHALYVGVMKLARSLEFDEILFAFEADLELRVAEFARGSVFVHAGVVGWRGGAIVLPGQSFTGKSTLVEALVRAGADYYSDEYAVLDAKGRVRPYARPLSLRTDAEGGVRVVRPQDFGGRTGKKPLPVEHVILTRFRPGAQWRPRKCSTGQAIMALLGHTIPARRKPAAVLTALRNAVAGASVLRGSRGEAQEFALRLLNSSPARVTDRREDGVYAT